MSHSFFLTCLWFGFLLAVDAKNQQQCNERSKTTCPVNQKSCNNTNTGACKTDNDCPCPQRCCIVNCKRACVVLSAKNATTPQKKNGTVATNRSSKNSFNQTAQIVPRSGNNQSTGNQNNQAIAVEKNETVNGDETNQTEAAGNQKNQTNSTSITSVMSAATKQNVTITEPTTNNQSSAIAPRSATGPLTGMVNNATVSPNNTETSNNGTKNETKPSEMSAAKADNQIKADNQSKAGKPLEGPIITPRSFSGKPIFPGSGDDNGGDLEPLGTDNENDMLGGGAAEEIAPKDQQLDDDDYSDPGELAKKKAKAQKPNKVSGKAVPVDVFKLPQTTKVPKPKTPRPALVPEEKEIMKNLRLKMRRTQHAQGFEHSPDDEEDKENKTVRSQKEEKSRVEKEQQNVARRKLQDKTISKPEFQKFDDKFGDNVELEGKKRKKTKKERIEDTDIEESNRQTKQVKTPQENPEYDYPEENNRKKNKSNPNEKNPDYDDQFTNSKTRDKDAEVSDSFLETMSAGKINRKKMNEGNLPKRIRKPDQGEYFSGEVDGLRQRKRKLKTEDKFTEDDSLPKRERKPKLPETILHSPEDLPELPAIGKPKLRRKNLAETEFVPEDSNKTPPDSKITDYEDLPKAIRESKRPRKLPFTEATKVQSEPNTKNKSFATSAEPTLKPEKLADTTDVPESDTFQKDGKKFPFGDGSEGQQKSTPSPRRRTPPPAADDLVMKHRHLILQMLYKVPRLLQKTVYKGKTVPPMVVKLPNGEYIYAPPFPGYDAKPLEPEEQKEANKKEYVKTAQQTPFTLPWSKFLLNSRPFGQKAPGNYPYPIIMVISRPDDIFNLLPEQGLPSFDQFYSQLKMPFYINKHFNKKKTANEPERINVRPVQ